MTSDMFSQLIAVSWRGVSFPIAGFRATLEHDLIEHKYVDQDGAHIEAVGRAPLRFSARALFRNGIVPGATERWGLLYPDGWRAFMKVAAARVTGTLTHPELGDIRCKLHSADTSWDASVRDGVDVDVAWIETQDKDSSLESLLGDASPISSAYLGALDLDASVISTEQKKRLGILPNAPAGPSFGDMINGVQALLDTRTVMQNRASGIMDGAVYRARLLADSATRSADPRQWPVKRAAARIEAAANDLRAVTVSRAVRLYRTPRAMTLASIAAALQREVKAVVSLNPGLVRYPAVPADVDVRYYADAAA